MEEEGHIKKQLKKEKNNNQNLNINSNIGTNSNRVFNFPSSQNQDKLWTIIFERKYDDDLNVNKSDINKIYVKINSNDLISNAISKYFIISRENINYLKFSFKGKILNPSMPLIAYGLTNNSLITVEEEEIKIKSKLITNF